MRRGLSVFCTPRRGCEFYEEDPIGFGAGRSDRMQPEENAVIDKNNPADIGKVLRLMALTMTPQSLQFSPDAENPQVYGLLTDWNVDKWTVSILAMKDGNASVYSTFTYGIIGGQGLESVQRAAARCAKEAGKYYAKSMPVSDYPYPKQGQVNFYLLTFDGVRLLVGDEAGINAGTDSTWPLFAATQDVLTEFRHVAGPTPNPDP
jgi:hypothetical protein